MEAALKEKENSLSSLEEVARVQRDECSKFRCCWILVFRSLSWFLSSELRQQVVDEATAKEAVNTTLMAAQAEYADLERTVVSV